MVFEKLKKRMKEKQKEKEELKAYERDLKKKYQKKAKEEQYKAKQKALEQKYAELAKQKAKPKSQRLKENWDKFQKGVKPVGSYLGRVSDNVMKDIDKESTGMKFNFEDPYFSTPKRYKKRNIKRRR